SLLSSIALAMGSGMANEKQIVDALRKRGNKITPQRLLSIKVLMTLDQHHFSVEELFQAVLE
ncbi:hypothetical protein, partial [Klebsiella aerogenes]|uniref:hypothetical protein n=1 Tax=Klebsiella aerogenes TaxID=548 RepID=UPI0019534589